MAAACWRGHAAAGLSIAGFSDQTDPIPATEPADRLGTFIAHKETNGGQTVHRLDIRVRYENETVFFEIQPLVVVIWTEAGGRAAHFSPFIYGL